MARSIYATLVLFSVIAACGPRTGVEDPDRFGADQVFDTLDGEEEGTRLTNTAITTEIDTITFAPTGTAATSFPADTPRLYFCFRLRNAPPGARLEVSWYREGADSPLSSSREVVRDESRLAAEHNARDPFFPGPHYIRVDLDGEELARYPFTIEGEGGAAAGPRKAQVVGLGLYNRVDKRGTPKGRAVSRYKQGTTSIHCAFRVKGAPPGTAVEVRWHREGRRVGTTNLGKVAGNRRMSASIETEAPLPTGDYRVLVLLDGIRWAATGFIIGRRSGGGPSFTEIALTTAINPRNRRPAAPASTQFDSDTQTLYVCAQYDGLSRNDEIEVRWYQNTMPGAPMGRSNIQVNNRAGTFAASFSPDGFMPPGDYHVDLVLRDDVIETVEFTVGQ